MKQWFKNKSNRFWLVASIFIVVKLCLHFFTNTNYELHRDEMLYFNMSDHLDWGYASVPPVIGFLALVIKTLFGYSVFGIRLLPALLGAGSMYIMTRIIQKLGGGVLALAIALSSFLFSTGFLLFDSLFTPNVIEHFLWLLITWYFLRLTMDHQPKHWIWIGVFAGIAFLNKYSVVLLMAGFVTALIFSPYKKLFYSRYFVIAILTATVIVLPHIYWQYSHNWPVVFHLKELNRTQLVNMNSIDFITDVFSINMLATIVWMIGLFVLLLSAHEKKYQPMATGILITILLFFISRGKGYYIMGLIPFLFVAGGYAMEKYLKNKLKWINYGIIAISLVTSLIALPYALPVMSLDNLSRYSAQTGELVVYPFSRWEDGKVHPVSQVYADMTGWKELTSLVAKTYFSLSLEEQKTCTIFGEKNYGYAGAVHFYGKRYGLPDAITFLDSYVIWAPENIPEGPMIYINYDPGDLNNLYHSVIEKGCVTDPYFREKGLKVYLCTHAKTNVPDVYSQLVSKAKLVYRK